MSIRNSLVALLLFGFSTSVVYATPVTFDVTDIGGGAGEALEAGMTFTDSGLTIAVAIATTLGNGTGMFNAAGGQSGIDSDGVTGGGGDAASELDEGETLTFSFTYAPSLLVTLDSINLQGVGGDDNSDSAFVSINGGAPITLHTNIPGFAGGSDIFTTGGISFPSGGIVVLTTNNRVGIQRFTFTVVPEPGSAALACLGVVGWVARRRRK